MYTFGYVFGISTIAKQEGVKLDKKGQWVDADGNVIDIEALMAVIKWIMMLLE